MMNVARMIRLCDTAKRQLESLEPLLSYFVSDHEVSRFVYESLAAVKELRHIARRETTWNVTTEQATHIQHIAARVRHYMRLVPGNARKLPDDG